MFSGPASCTTEPLSLTSMGDYILEFFYWNPNQGTSRGLHGLLFTVLSWHKSPEPLNPKPYALESCQSALIRANGPGKIP